MRKIVLFIAMSLDGYIADQNGNVDWLSGQEEIEGQDSYSYFIKDIDTVIMGYNTYAQIVNELSIDEWVYQGMQTYVLTHKYKTSKEEITFINCNVCELINDLKELEGKNIWICGGADIIHQLMKNDCIDRYYISIIPTILGKGIKLFNEISNELKLELIETNHQNGIVELIYLRRKV